MANEVIPIPVDPEAPNPANHVAINMIIEAPAEEASPAVPAALEAPAKEEALPADPAALEALAEEEALPQAHVANEVIPIPVNQEAPNLAAHETPTMPPDPASRLQNIISNLQRRV